MNKFRQLTDKELDTLNRLLSADFEGVIELRQQVENLTTPSESGFPTGDLSIPLVVSGNAKADVKTRIPVELKDHKDPNHPWDVLLHVIGGFMSELEFVYYGKDEKPEVPNLEEFELMVNSA